MYKIQGNQLHCLQLKIIKSLIHYIMMNQVCFFTKIQSFMTVQLINNLEKLIYYN